ncbi:MAG: Septum formation protein Maf [Massilibacillus sp.]|jgi:septum formation protein|nr:Septum formation protein Maf [Massilibacillus sp.]
MGDSTLIILASSSPRRQELLNQIGCKFNVVPSAAEEDNSKALPPEQLVINNAVAKAQEVADKLAGNDVILGADTIVVMNDEVYGKPVNVADAKRMLSSLSGNVHTVYTGIALIKGNTVWRDFEKTTVKLSKLTSEEIDKYIATGEPMDKAGAYAIQGIATVFIEEIQGCYTNVVGLPLNKLANLCKKAGINLL